MKDSYIVFTDGRSVLISDLSDRDIAESLDVLDSLIPMDGTDATHDSIRERLKIEQLIRAKGW